MVLESRDSAKSRNLSMEGHNSQFMGCGLRSWLGELVTCLDVYFKACLSLVYLVEEFGLSEDCDLHRSGCQFVDLLLSSILSLY